MQRKFKEGETYRLETAYKSHSAAFILGHLNTIPFGAERSVCIAEFAERYRLPLELATELANGIIRYRLDEVEGCEPVVVFTVPNEVDRKWTAKAVAKREEKLRRSFGGIPKGPRQYAPLPGQQSLAFA